MSNDQDFIYPYFTVKDADLLITFMGDVFGASIIKEDRYDDGTIQHARLMVGTSLMMLNQATASYPENTSQMYVNVAAVADIYALALAHGATSIMPPEQRPHGELMAGFTDPCGNIWWVAERQK